jgi:hypothetical protein
MPLGISIIIIITHERSPAAVAAFSYSASISPPHTHFMRLCIFSLTIGRPSSYVLPLNSSPCISYTSPACRDVACAFCVRGRRTFW